MEIIANECLSAVSTTPAINCSAVPTTPLTNLSLVSTTPAIILVRDFHRSAVSIPVISYLSVSLTPAITFFPGVVDTGHK